MSQMLMAIFVAYLKSDIAYGKKFRRDLKMVVILKMSKYNAQLQNDNRNKKIIPNYARKNFHGDDVIDDVTEWPQISHSIFLYGWKNNIFRYNWRTNKDIIFKLSVQI